MRRKTALACALFLLAAGLTGATTLVKMEFSDLAAKADGVVLGTVTSTIGQWDTSGRFIHTDVTISIDEYLLGEGPSEITLRTPGGRIGDEGQLAHGAPTFTDGNQVLVFLTLWEDGTPKVLGYSQGKSSAFFDVDGRIRLEGGRAGGRTLEGVRDELKYGTNHNIPLRPVR